MVLVDTSQKQSLLELKLFGSMQLFHDGLELRLATRKLSALIIYLVLEGETSRAKLADLFWSDHVTEDARRNLRRELYRIRETALRDIVIASDHSVRILEPPKTDLATMHTHLKAGQLEAALLLSQDELLEGLFFTGAEGFAAWLELQRAEVRKLRRQAMLDLSERLETKGDWIGAIALHRQILMQDALQERSHRQIMRLQALLGEREAALQQFMVCQLVLKSELGLEPLPETMRLAERIRLSENTEVNLVKANPNLQAKQVPMVGRVGLQKLFLDSKAKLRVLRGEAGIGKTRLLETTATQAFWFRFRLSTQAIAFAALTHSIRVALNQPELVFRLSALEPIWQHEAARLVPEILGQVVFHEIKSDEKARFLEGLARTLECLVEDGYLIALDDLQWADQACLELIALMLQRPNSRIRFVATARAFEPTLNTWLQGLEKIGQVEQFEVLPLEIPEMNDLVELFMGSKIDLSVLPASSLNSGNPFFMLETLRYWQERGELLSRDGQWVFNKSPQFILPSSVIAMVLERIEALGSSAKRLLETAVLTQDGFKLEEIQSATALNEWEGLESIERCVEASVLKLTSSQTYAFAHDIIRQALESTLGADRKRLIHKKLAANLEPDPNPNRIAFHLEQAGLAGQAVAWRIKAARFSEQIYAFEDALQHYRQALPFAKLGEQWKIRRATVQIYLTQNLLELLDSELLELLKCSQTEQLGAVWLLQSQCLNAQSRHAEVKDMVQRIRAEDISIQAAAQFELAFANHRLGQFQASQELLEQTLAAFKAMPQKLKIQLHDLWRVNALRNGNLEQSLVQIGIIQKLASGTQDLSLQVRMLHHQAQVQFRLFQYQAAVQNLEEALKLATQIASVGLQQRTLINLAAVQNRQGESEKAIAALKSSLALPSQADPYLHSYAHNNLGSTYEKLGLYGLALTHYQAGLEAARGANLTTEIILCGLNVLQLSFDLHWLGQLGLLFEISELMKRSQQQQYSTWLVCLKAQRCLLEQQPKTAIVHLQTLTDQDLSEDDFDLKQLFFARAYLMLNQAKKAQQKLLVTPKGQRFTTWILAQKIMTFTESKQLAEAISRAKALEPEPTLESLEIAKALGDSTRAAQLKQLIAATLIDFPSIQNYFLELG